MRLRRAKLLMIITCCIFTAVNSYAQNTYYQTPFNGADTSKHTSATDTSKQKTVAAKPQYHYVKPKPKGPKPIRTELSGGIRINTDGWGFFVDKGYVRSSESRQSDMFYNMKIWQFEFDEKKSPREMKSSSQDQSTGTSLSSFIYGKINNFYTLKAGLGWRRMIAGKPDPGTVSIHWVNVIGVSLGLLKPYYIKAYSNGGEQTIKYTDQTKDVFLNPGDIIGAGGFSQGLSETKPVPGAHFKTALHFDFAANRKTVLAIETGANAEIYTQSIALMAGQKAVPYFFNLYASFQFGKRW